MEVVVLDRVVPVGDMEDIAHQLMLVNSILSIGFEKTIKNRYDEDLMFLKRIEHLDIYNIREQLTQKLLSW